MPSKRNTLPQGMIKDAYKYFFESYEEVSTVYDQVFDVEGSDASYEQYTTAIGPNKLTKTAEGVAIPRQTASEGFTVICANFKYPAELAITNEAIDDHQKVDNYLRAWASGLGETVRNKRESEHAGVFNEGGFTSGSDFYDNSIAGIISPSYGNVAYDSKPFFTLEGNERTAKHGGTYFNSIADLTLNGTGLQKITQLISVTNAINEAGLEVQLMPNVLLCQFGSDVWYTAKRLLESTGDADSVHAGIKNIHMGALKLIGWRFLTDSNAFYVGIAKRGLKSLARKEPVIDFYEDKSIDSQVVRMRARWGRAVLDFRPWAAANISTS